MRVVADYRAFNAPPYLMQALVDSDVARLLACSDLQFNSLEEAVHAMLNQFWLDHAEGAQLDLLGIHLILNREGRSDTSYKALLNAKALINTASGQPDVLLEAIRTLFGSSIVLYEPDYPAKAIIQHDGVLLVIGDNAVLEDGDNFVLENGDQFVFLRQDSAVNQFLSNMSPVGVQITLILCYGDWAVLEGGVSPTDPYEDYLDSGSHPTRVYVDDVDGGTP